MTEVDPPDVRAEDSDEAASLFEAYKDAVERNDADRAAELMPEIIQHLFSHADPEPSPWLDAMSEAAAFRRTLHDAARSDARTQPRWQGCGAFRQDNNLHPGSATIFCCPGLSLPERRHP